MRIKCWLWMLLTGYLLASTEAYAQCSSIRSDVQKIRKNTGGKPAQQLAYAFGLQKRWQECKQPFDTTFVQLLLLTGDLLLNQAKYNDAAQQYQWAVRLASTNAELRTTLAQANYLLGTSFLYDNRAAEAKTAFSSALASATKQPACKKWGILSRINLAYLSYSQGDYQQSLIHAEAGQEWASTLNDGALTAKVLREKANALYALGRYDEAASSAQKMILVATDARLTNLGQYYLMLGDIESNRNHTRAAVEAYQTAATHYRLANDLVHQAFVLTNLGFLYYRQTDYQQAIRCNNQALILQKNPFSRARLFDNLAACWWKMGKFEKALATYQQGLTTMPIGFSEKRTDRNPLPQSIRLALRKEFLLTLIQDKADTWLDYAKATTNTQRFRYALNTYAVADQMIDFMRWEHTGQQSKLYWRQKTRGLYERAIETCYLLGDTEQAFRFLEKSRAVMLTDKLNELGARQKLALPQIEQEQRLRQAVNDQQNKLAELSPDSANYALMRGALLNKQDSLDTFLTQLEASNPAYYRYKYDNSTTTLADLQRYLKKQSGSLVTYFVGDSALYVMSVTGDKAVLRKQSIKLYNQTLNQFAGLLASPEAMNKLVNVKRFLTLSHSLYRQLLAPLNLPKGRVVISPDGFFVPFDALSRSESQPDYVIKDYAFSYAYSASLLLKNSGRPARIPYFQTHDFLGIAPVDFSRLGQVTLSGSEVALKPIADRFGSSMLLTHQTATRRAFQTQAPSYRVIHLFTHANADSTDQEPMLYFSDSTMRLSALGDGTLPNAELVVLAACKTGIGANQRGEGVFSLARGFSALGVPSVLTTLWSVQNQATYQLTSLFYKYLDEGHPKDIALQRAKQEWLTNAGGVNQLPNYWAGLIIVGDAEPLSRAHYWPWIVSLLIICLVGLGSWRYWQKRPVKLVNA